MSRPVVRARPNRNAALPTSKNSGHKSSNGNSFVVAAVGLLASIVVFKLHLAVPGFPTAIRPALLLSPVVLLIAWKFSTAESRAALFTNRLLLGILAYIAWTAITVPFAVYPRLAFETAFGFLPLAVFVIVIGLLPATRATIDGLLFSFMSGAGMLAAAALVRGDYDDGRLLVSSFDPNELAALMAMVVPLAIGQSMRGRLALRLWSIVVVVLSAVVVIKTDSRGSSIGYAVAVLTLVLLSTRQRRIVGLGLAGVAAVAVWSLAPESYRERMVTLGTVEADYNVTSYYGRTQLWKRGLQYAADNPLLGVGVGCYSEAEGLRLREEGSKGQWLNAHNAYIQALAELGIVGGGLFVVLILGSFRSALRVSALSKRVGQVRSSVRPEIGGSIVGLAVASVFLSFAYFVAWFALWALCASLSRANRTSESAVVPAPRRALRALNTKGVTDTLILN